MPVKRAESTAPLPVKTHLSLTFMPSLASPAPPRITAPSLKSQQKGTGSNQELLGETLENSVD